MQASSVQCKPQDLAVASKSKGTDQKSEQQAFYEQNYEIVLNDILLGTKPHYTPIIRKVQIALGNSFILQIGNDKVKHINLDGSLLKQLTTKKEIKQLFMISEEILMIIEVAFRRAENDSMTQIILWNLKNNQKTTVEHKPWDHLLKVQLFYESQLLCLCELRHRVKNNVIRRYEDLKSRLQETLIFTCFRIKPNKCSIQYQPFSIASFVLNQNQDSRQFLITKLNANSIGLISQKPQQEYNLCFYICNLLQNKPNFQQVRLRINQQQKDHRNRSEAFKEFYSLRQVFQIKPSLFFFRCCPGKSLSKSYKYSWDNKKKQSTLIGINENQFDIIQLVGNYRSLAFQSKNKLIIEYLNSTTLQVITNQSRIQNSSENSRDLTNVKAVPYNNKTFIEFSENLNISENQCKISIKVRSVNELKYPGKVIVLDMICLATDNEGDDDLLFQAFELLAQTYNFKLLE